jgi:hypothetical protein
MENSLTRLGISLSTMKTNILFGKDSIANLFVHVIHVTVLETINISIIQLRIFSSDD